MTTLTARYLDAGAVVLRKAREHDRGSIIDHVADPDVRAHLGGPQPRAAVARDLDEAGVAAATASAGSYVIADRATDAFLGTVSLTRRGVHHPGHLGPAGEELELAYTLNRPLWGRGLAHQAASALLHAAACTCSSCDARRNGPGSLRSCPPEWSRVASLLPAVPKLGDRE